MKLTSCSPTTSKFLYFEIEEITLVVLSLTIHSFLDVLDFHLCSQFLSLLITAAPSRPFWFYSNPFHHSTLSKRLPMVSNSSAFPPFPGRQPLNEKLCLLLSFFTNLYLWRFCFRRPPPAEVRLKTSFPCWAKQSLIRNYLQTKLSRSKSGKTPTGPS